MQSYCRFCYLQWMFGHTHYIELLAEHHLFHYLVIHQNFIYPSIIASYYFFSDKLITSGRKRFSSAKSFWRVFRRAVNAGLFIKVMEAMRNYSNVKWWVLSILLSSKCPIEKVPNFSNIEVGQNNLITKWRSLQYGSYEPTCWHKLKDTEMWVDEENEEVKAFDSCPFFLWWRD